jgi:hypothetical protein
MEPTTKKFKTHSRTSKESREKENNKRKEATKFNNLFIEMIQKELPDSKVTNKDLPTFLFKLAGYDFDPVTFHITQRPSKFGGVWREIQQPVDKQMEQTIRTCSNDAVELLYLTLSWMPYLLF